MTTASHTGLPGLAGHHLGLYTCSFVSFASKSVPVCFNAPSPSQRPSPRALPAIGACHSLLPALSSFLLSLFPVGRALHGQGLSCSLSIPSTRGQYRYHQITRGKRVIHPKCPLLPLEPRSPSERPRDSSSVPAETCPSLASFNIYSVCVCHERSEGTVCVNNLADTIRV